MIGRMLCVFVALMMLTSELRAVDAVLQFFKAVKSPALTQEELLSVTLDTDVFAATRDGLPDLRLLDAEGRQVPFVLRKAKTSRKEMARSTWTARDPSVRPLENGGLEITVQLLPNDPPASGLTLITPLDNFEKRVRVETSTDGAQWEPAGDETLIFDYSRYMDVRHDSVAFPETTRRHFRIVIDEVTARQESELLELTRRLTGAEETERVERFTIERRPFRIDRLDFWREIEQERPDEDAKQSYPPRGFRVEQVESDRETHIYVDTHREPLTSLILQTADRNFSRAATVEVEQVDGVRRTWEAIGTATLSRIDFKTLNRERLSISFPESRQEQFRIVIENRDSPPLDVDGVEAEGNVYEAMFLAAPDGQYRLAYGDERVKPAAYDTAAIQELLRSRFTVTRTSLGKQQTTSDLRNGRSLDWRDLLNNPVMLAAVILTLVIALGFGLYRAAGRIDAAGPADEETGPPDTAG